jgi:hypothetical protein
LVNEPLNVAFRGSTVDEKLGAAIAEGSKLRKLMSKARNLLRGTGYSSSARNPEILELKNILKRRHDGDSSTETASPTKSSSSSEVSARQLGYMDLAMSTPPTEAEPPSFEDLLSAASKETISEVAGHAADEAIPIRLCSAIQPTHFLNRVTIIH